METLCIMSFMLWASLQISESGQCPNATSDSRDLDVCSAASIANVSVVRLVPTPSVVFKPCFCDIKLHKSTSLSFAYYGPDSNACGIQIKIENIQFTCQSGVLLLIPNESARMTYTYDVHYDWCMVLRTEPPGNIDARFSITCNSDIVSSYPSSSLPITDTTAANATVTNAFRLTTDYTGESQSSYHTTSDTPPLITNWTSSESQPRKALTDIHIVIIAVISTCLLLAAITALAIYCFVCRRAKGTHSYENNALEDVTNLQSTHDYKNITNQKSFGLEVINQMNVPADAMDFTPTNPSETSTDDRYADVSEITVKRNTETDKRVVNSVSNESNQGINGDAEIHESGISEADVDPQYAVVQKNRDTESKAKKVSFSDNKQDLPAIPVESNGTDNLYAQVSKKSEQQK